MFKLMIDGDVGKVKYVNITIYTAAKTNEIDREKYRRILYDYLLCLPVFERNFCLSQGTYRFSLTYLVAQAPLVWILVSACVSLNRHNNSYEHFFDETFFELLAFFRSLLLLSLYFRLDIESICKLLQHTALNHIIYCRFMKLKNPYYVRLINYWKKC